MLTPEQIIESGKKLVVRSAEAYGVSTDLDREVTEEEEKLTEASPDTGPRAHCSGLHVEPETIAKVAEVFADDSDEEFAGFAFGILVGLQAAKDYDPFDRNEGNT